VNVLPQRGWIQSVVNGTDPDSDLKIWSNAIPSTNAADIVEMANCMTKCLGVKIVLPRRKSILHY
jgi:predicted nucleotidyltransferase